MPFYQNWTLIALAAVGLSQFPPLRELWGKPRVQMQRGHGGCRRTRIHHCRKSASGRIASVCVTDSVRPRAVVATRVPVFRIADVARSIAFDAHNYCSYNN
jgi:hypothetical protein